MIRYRFRVWVDWDQDDVYTEIDRVLDWQVARGRSNANDQVAAGTAEFKVIDDLGVYTPRNTLGPLYGLLLPDRPMYMEIEVEDYGTARVFTGRTTAIGNSHPHGELWKTPISSGDAFDYLRLSNIRTDILEGLRVDEVLEAVLDEAGWGAGLRDLDVSTVDIDRAWWYRATPLEAIVQTSKNSLGGHAFPDRDGNIAFRDYTARATSTSHMTIVGGRTIDTELRREDFVDKVRYRRAGLDVATGYTALFTLAPPGRVVYPGSSHPDNTWHFEYGVGGKDVQTPTAYVDYTFNSEQDGTGIDRTPQVLVDSFTNYGGGGSITWEGLDASPVYVQTFNVRGQAVRRSNDERTIEVDALSPVVSGVILGTDFEFQDDAQRIRAFANYRAAVANNGQTRTTIQIKPWTSEILYQLATLEFGDRVTLDIPAAYLSGDWFVERIQISGPGHNAEPPTWSLLLYPADSVGGNLFRISPSVGTGYSTIVAAAATAGDRIAY